MSVESLLVIIFFSPFYVFIFFEFLWDSLMAYDSQFWYVTKGEIVSIKEKKYTLVSSRVPPPRVPLIKYKYTVDNNTYFSSRIVYGNICLFSPCKYKEYLSMGNTIYVYYKPDNPKVAVLKPGFNEEYAVEAFLSIFIPIMVIFGIMFC